MKNRKLVESLDKIRPSMQQKEKMLDQILKRETKQFSWGYVWNIGLATMCFLCFCFINTGYYSGNSATNRPRVVMYAQNNFCYKDAWYQKLGELKSSKNLKYLDTIDQIEVYQGEEGYLILKQDGSYFMYQKVEDSK